jgi:hypothetical protein
MVMKKTRTIGTVLREVVERVNDDTQRLRLIEQSNESLLSRMNTLEQVSLQSRRGGQKESEDLGVKIDLLADRLDKAENTMREIIGQMKKLVTESRVKELEGLIQLYNPVKSSFVTREELDSMLKDGRKKQK